MKDQVKREKYLKRQAESTIKSSQGPNALYGNNNNKSSSNSSQSSASPSSLSAADLKLLLKQNMVPDLSNVTREASQSSLLANEKKDEEEDDVDSVLSFELNMTSHSDIVRSSSSPLTTPTTPKQLQFSFPLPRGDTSRSDSRYDDVIATPARRSQSSNRRLSYSELLEQLSSSAPNLGLSTMYNEEVNQSSILVGESGTNKLSKIFLEIYKDEDDDLEDDNNNNDGTSSLGTNETPTEILRQSSNAGSSSRKNNNSSPYNSNDSLGSSNSNQGVHPPALPSLLPFTSSTVSPLRTPPSSSPVSQQQKPTGSMHDIPSEKIADINTTHDNTPPQMEQVQLPNSTIKTRSEDSPVPQQQVRQLKNKIEKSLLATEQRVSTGRRSLDDNGKIQGELFRTSLFVQQQRSFLQVEQEMKNKDYVVLDDFGHRKQRPFLLPAVRSERNIDTVVQEQQKTFRSSAATELERLLNPDTYNDEDMMKFLNFFPLAALMKYEIQSFAQSINHQQDFIGAGGGARTVPLFPLSMLCAFGANHDVIAFCYKQNPKAIRFNDLWVGTPLHYAISYGVTAAARRGASASSIMEVLMFLMDKAPGLLESQENLSSHTVLHKACLCLCSPSSQRVKNSSSRMIQVESGGAVSAELSSRIIGLVLERCPSLSACPDSDMRLPLHMAAQRVAENQILTQLLAANPQACYMDCLVGKTPLHYAVESAAEDIRRLAERKDITSVGECRDGISDNQLSKGNEEGNMGIGKEWSRLVQNEFDSTSMVLQDHCHNIEALLESNPHAAQMTDHNGQLPLHVLVAAVPTAASTDSSDESLNICSLLLLKMIRCVSQAFPGAAETADYQGNTPLAMAFQYDKIPELVSALIPASSNKESSKS